MQSDSNSLNHRDYIAIAKNALIFAAPALLVFLTAIQSGTPLRQALTVVYLFALNIAIDTLRKYVAGG